MLLDPPKKLCFPRGMKISLLAIAVVVIVISIVGVESRTALAWGGRGHHITGEMAAITLRNLAEGEYSQDFIRFYRDRSIPLGHVSDIPDLTWKNRVERPRITQLNFPTHFLDVEFLLGEPTTPVGPYLEKFRKLPDNYAALLARYQGQSNPLPATSDQRKKLTIYEDVGTAPWRAQQLYDLLVLAFRCARSKETSLTTAKATQVSPFLLPADGTGQTDDPPLPTYQCLPNQPRDLDLEAIVILSGLLSHFVADLTMPYHPTSNFDGWVTGNGGIHAYFEVDVLNGLDQNLALDVLKQSESKIFQSSLLKKLNPPPIASSNALGLDAGSAGGTRDSSRSDLQSTGGVARMMLALGAESYSHLEAVAALDDRVAILKKSAQLPWGDLPYSHPAGTLAAAERRPADTPSVLRAFRPLIVQRLATASFLIARAWYAAWDAGGRPKFPKVTEWQLRYPVDPPFIWPDYDPAAILRSKK